MEIQIVKETEAFHIVATALVEAAQWDKKTVSTSCPHCHYPVKIEVPLLISKQDKDFFDKVITTTINFIEEKNISIMLIRDLIKRIRMSMKNKIRLVK